MACAKRSRSVDLDGSVGARSGRADTGRAGMAVCTARAAVTPVGAMVLGDESPTGIGMVGGAHPTERMGPGDEAGVVTADEAVAIGVEEDVAT